MRSKRKRREERHACLLDGPCLPSRRRCSAQPTTTLRRRAASWPSEKVPVVSVGNLTWGGNGKTPMVDFLARRFLAMPISPLILTRGYAGGDESRMLRRRLSHTSAKVGVGASRAAVASAMLQKYGYVHPCDAFCWDKHSSPCNPVVTAKTDKIGMAILDDGMQHRSLLQDVEVVMVNGLTPWGNTHFIPRGPMRNSLSALSRADTVVIHHADLDLQLIQERVKKLVDQHSKETIVLVTEKDYDRDPDALRTLDLKVWVLYSSLQIMPLKEQGEDEFMTRVKEIIATTRHGKSHGERAQP